MSGNNPPGLDPERLRAHLDRDLPGLASGPLEARLIEGGRSNLTTRSPTGPPGGWSAGRRSAMCSPPRTT